MIVRAAEKEMRRENIRDSPSRAFRYTVFATMFSNSINSSLIGLARPNRVGEDGSSWSTTTSAGDVGGGRYGDDGELELDRAEHVRVLSREKSLHGVDHPAGGLCETSSHLRPRDTTRVHDPSSPFTEDQRERENPPRETCLDCDYTSYDRFHWTHSIGR